MNSAFGVRGVICERFGWTYDYLMHEIPWLDVHFMMVDAPRFVLDPVDESGKPKPITQAGSSDKSKPQSPGDKLKSLLLKHV